MASRRGPDYSVRTAIQGTKQGSSWANVFFCQLSVSGTPAQADLDAWVDAFATAYKNNIGANQSTDVTYVQARSTLFLPGGTVLESLRGMTGAGANTGTILNDNSACWVISWTSSVYWRGGKPRTYFPGLLTNESTDARTLTSGTRTSNTNQALAFRTAVNALTHGAITGTALGFVSFRSGNADRPAPLFFAVTGAVSHPRIGTQRRRLGKWSA